MMVRRPHIECFRQDGVLPLNSEVDFLKRKNRKKVIESLENLFIEVFIC